MLSSLLQTIEQAFGSSLSSASDVLFLVGIAMLGYVVLAPLLRIAVDFQSARIGMEREWVMHCLSCRRMTVVAGAECEHCGTKLGIPWMVRIRQFFSRAGEPHWLRVFRWIYTVCGVAAFTAASLFAMGGLGAWSPQNNIEKLFIGLSLLTWAGLGWLLGRIVGIGTGGPVTRIRDAVFSLALVAVLIITITLATAARPVEETVVAQVRVDGQVAQLGTEAVALAGHQLGFEYLLVEHGFAGYRNITPLAIVGVRRIDLPMTQRRTKVVNFLWGNADTLSARGLSVRKRTDQFMVTQSGIYEIVLRGEEIMLRQYASPS